MSEASPEKYPPIPIHCAEYVAAALGWTVCTFQDPYTAVTVAAGLLKLVAAAYPPQFADSVESIRKIWCDCGRCVG
jgi:hypothetical protein